MFRQKLPISIQTFREIREEGHYYVDKTAIARTLALQQLIERGYADKYRARDEPIHLIGVEFSRERRSVVGVEVGGEGAECSSLR